MTNVALATRVELFEVRSLVPYARNARTHPDQQVRQLADMITAFGFTNPVLLDGERGIIAGHARVAAARLLGMKVVPGIQLSHLSPAQKRAYILADNQLTLRAAWNVDLLRYELERLEADGVDLSLSGFAEEELARLLAGVADEAPAGEPQEGDPPMGPEPELQPTTVFNARLGWWQERKREWIALGIQSEIGRELGGNDKAFNSRLKREVQCESTRAMFAKGFQEGGSVFDPVLCEAMYRFYCPPEGLVLDPFAGGSVRGVVAAKLQRRYVGNELRAEQVEANQQQWQSIGTEADLDYAPVWHVGDSDNIGKTLKGIEADMVFSCPPYADLERYSDDPADLSTMAYPDFLAAYRRIVAAACGLLKPDRFAVFVVGEVRGEDGIYLGLVPDTIAAFEAAGLALVSEAVLVTPVGSNSMRAGLFFAASRKLAKTHQNVLVFVKGDANKALHAVRS